MQETIDRLRDWAAGEEAVRAMLLIGSRADARSDVDALSDFDVVLFLSDERQLTTQDEWLEELGSPLVMLREQVTYLDRPVATRLVQYRDGPRIDFTLAPVAILERLPELDRLPEPLDRGYRVLLDGDGLTARVPEPSGTAYTPEPPGEAEYLELVQEFWWESTCVAKHLRRGELLPAKYSMECVLRFRCLMRMLEWYVQIDRGWGLPVGPHGKGLAAVLGPEDRDALNATFGGPRTERNWAALFAAISLFRRAARRVAGDLGYRYPADLDREVMALLESVRSS